MGCLVDEAVLQYCQFLLDLPVVTLEDPDMDNSRFTRSFRQPLSILPSSHV